MFRIFWFFNKVKQHVLICFVVFLSDSLCTFGTRGQQVPISCGSPTKSLEVLTPTRLLGLNSVALFTHLIDLGTSKMTMRQRGGTLARTEEVCNYQWASCSYNIMYIYICTLSYYPFSFRSPHQNGQMALGTDLNHLRSKWHQLLLLCIVNETF